MLTTSCLHTSKQVCVCAYGFVACVDQMGHVQGRQTSSHCQCDTAVTIRYHARPAPFPWRCLCVSVWVRVSAISVPVHWQGHYLPYTVHVHMREEDSWLNNSRNTSEKLPDQPKSSQMGFHMNTHTHTVWAAHSACQGLITLLVVQRTISVHRSWLNTTRQLVLPK